MLPHIHNESPQLFAEKTTQTRMDARLTRRASLHHTIYSRPVPPQQRQLYMPPSLEPGYVMEPLALKKSIVDPGVLIDIETTEDDENTNGDHANDEHGKEDEDSAWLNDRLLPRPASAMRAPILKDQLADQQTLTCWL